MSAPDWDNSAQAWIASMSERGDWLRANVLDPALSARFDLLEPGRALDVGCGEGRNCRMLAARGFATTGLDPVAALIEEARRRDPHGTYVVAGGEEIPLPDASFDLVLSCFSLIDIADFRRAIAEMVRVLAPGGTLLVANLASFASVPTQGVNGERWQRDWRGRHSHWKFDHYLAESSTREQWRGIDIVNHHRPLSAYMQAFLGHGLTLVHFDEPAPAGEDGPKAERFRRVPYALVMEWHKPAGLSPSDPSPSR